MTSPRFIGSGLSKAKLEIVLGTVQLRTQIANVYKIFVNTKLSESAAHRGLTSAFVVVAQ